MGLSEIGSESEKASLHSASRPGKPADSPSRYDIGRAAERIGRLLPAARYEHSVNWVSLTGLSASCC
jgi:hypothetical protein